MISIVVGAVAVAIAVVAGLILYTFLSNFVETIYMFMPPVGGCSPFAQFKY